MAVLLAAMLGFGIGYVAGAADGSRPAGPWPASAQHPAVAADADAYTLSGRPELRTGDHHRLLVGGGEDGVAVAYVRFTLDERPPPGMLAEARLRLRLDSVPASFADRPELLEVSYVEPTWSDGGLSANEAPPFGPVLDSVEVTTGTTEVGLDVTAAVAATRTHSFAITTPASDEVIAMHSREAGVAGPVLELDLRPPPVPAPSTPPVSPGPTLPEPSASPSTTLPTTVESWRPAPLERRCDLADNLVPRCGSLLGVAPGAHSDRPKEQALHDFEDLTGRTQSIYHAYERGDGRLFPTPEQIELAREPDKPRLLFINWKPRTASWADIAAGDPDIDAYLDELAAHIRQNFTEPFLFTVHHEPENDVRPKAGSGYTAADYADMFRYVVERLRAGGADNIVTVMVYMAYLKWTEEPWHGDLYPGDDVVDWVAWDTYGYSDPGHGFGDFAELVNRVSDSVPWPGFYRWAAEHFPEKPLMVAEWGVWYSRNNPGHQAEVFDVAAAQLGHFPRVKAVVYFESANAEGRDSRVDSTPATLDAYRRFGDSRHFSVDLR